MTENANLFIDAIVVGLPASVLTRRNLFAIVLNKFAHIQACP